jgi:hypothetical protein
VVHAGFRVGSLQGYQFVEIAEGPGALTFRYDALSDRLLVAAAVNVVVP